MHKTDQQIQQQITDLVEACTSYWKLRGVAHEDITEMQLELEQHLQQAIADGKSLEAVPGPHPLAFAEAWAQAMHPQILRGGAVILRGLIYALSIVSTTALFSQAFSGLPSFTFSLFAAYLLIGSGLLAILLPLGGFLAPRISTRTGREALILAGVVLVVLILRVAGVTVNWSAALFSWPWPVTALFLALAAGLFSLDCWRTLHRAPASAAATSSPTLRYVSVFVGSVAVFDVLLFVGSLAVFGFCRLALRLV
jgi:hypothetical protein